MQAASTSIAPALMRAEPAGDRGAASGISSSAAHGGDQDEVELGGATARRRRAPGGRRRRRASWRRSAFARRGGARARRCACTIHSLGHARAARPRSRSRRPASRQGHRQADDDPRPARVEPRSGGAQPVVDDGATAFARLLASGASASTPSSDLRTRPVSTLAGPGLDEVRSRRARAACRARSVQRTGCGQGVHEPVAHVVVEGRARSRRRDRDARRAELDRGEPASAERRDGGLHQRRVEGAGDGQALGAQPCARAAAPPPRSSASTAPERTSWSGALSLAIVRPGSAAICATGSRSRTAHGQHSAWPLGLLHQAAARRDEAQAVGGVDRARGDQGGDLAERVAGHRSASQRSFRHFVSRRALRRRSQAARSGCHRPRARRGRRDDLRARELEKVGPMALDASRMSAVWLPWPGNSIARCRLVRAISATIPYTGTVSALRAELPRPGVLWGPAGVGVPFEAQAPL